MFFDNSRKYLHHEIVNGKYYFNILCHETIARHYKQCIIVNAWFKKGMGNNPKLISLKVLFPKTLLNVLFIVMAVCAICGKNYVCIKWSLPVCNPEQCSQAPWIKNG